jgi:regulator of protease activity HflC (stomatin/prohibitin superfamily)
MGGFFGVLITFVVIAVIIANIVKAAQARGKGGESHGGEPQGCLQLLQALGKATNKVGPTTVSVNWGKFWPVVCILIALYYIATHSTIVIPGAHIACVYDPMRGGIQNDVLPEGLHIIPPWIKTAVFSVQTQQYTMSIAKNEGAVAGDDAIKCETNEGLKVALDVSVLFHIDPQHAPQLWRKLGVDYNNVFVRPVVRERIRMVVAKYSVQDVYSGKRAKLEDELTSELRAPFEAAGLVLEQLLMRNVAYVYDEFANAIAAKQARQQQVITEKRNLERAAFEKSATVNKAQGEAQSIALRARTLLQNPEVVSYDMAQKIGPRTRKAYLSEKTVPLPRGGD